MAVRHIFDFIDNRDSDCGKHYKSPETMIEDKCKYCKWNKQGEQRNLIQDNYSYDMERHWDENRIVASRKLTQEEKDAIEELIKEYENEFSDTDR